ncbi:MAG: hypothetical protein EBU49_11140, partial [Proteobacteria bacterium]|nr:hypothetical protein [Pseudomonadota bacterium]
TQISASSWSRPLVRVAKDMTIDAGLVCALLAAGIFAVKIPAGRRRPHPLMRRLAGVAGWTGFALLIGFSSPLTSNLLRAPLLKMGGQLQDAGGGCPMHPGPVVVLGGGATPDGLPASREILNASLPEGDRNLPIKIVLVTSQVHMARSAATFAKSNFQICAVIAPEPAPVFGLVTEAGWLNFSTARKTSATLNEWFGMLGYRVRGWI